REINSTCRREASRYPAQLDGVSGELEGGETVEMTLDFTARAARYFVLTQTEQNLRRDEVQGKRDANRTHYDVGKKARKTIEELGGTMPAPRHGSGTGLGNGAAAERRAVALEKEQKKLGKED